jgi:hypothetical protein
VITDPQRQLEAIAELTAALAVGWPMYESTEAALALPAMRSGSGDHRGTDTPDPVANIASSHERYYETAALAAEALGIAREIQRRHAAVRTQHPDLARDIDAAVRAARCTGIVGDDPTCARLAVTNVTYHGTPQPTCWACKKRAQRARAREAESA